MSHLNRRELVFALAALGIAPTLARAAGQNDVVFAHGVASGDPLHDRVVLWTKLTPSRLDRPVTGRWRVALDPRMQQIRRQGSFTTDARRDFTIKIDVDRLRPGATYYYQFEAKGARSVIGRTRTLPVGDVASLRFAFVSCSNYPQGYFNPYACIAARHDLAFVVHLGDYIYEYPLGAYVNPTFAGRRDVQPANEIVSLADYRIRHALYKSDPDLQEVHRQHPFICVWDDHELSNDAYRDGAENHDPEKGEGAWRERRAHAVRAYNEYMPIRSRGVLDAKTFRSFRIGDLADLIMLDTRLHGRDRQAAVRPGEERLGADDPTVLDPRRTLLGFDQEQWLRRELLQSSSRGTTWRLLGQQVLMAQLRAGTNFIANPDAWDGYAPARQRLFDHLREHDIQNNVVLTGDIHSSWCNDLTDDPWDAARYDPASSTNVRAVEFVTPAVSSPSPITDPAKAVERADHLRKTSPHMKYIDMLQRGYVLLDVNSERVQGEVYHVPTVESRSRAERLAAAFVSEARNNALLAVNTQSTAGETAEPAPPARL